MSKVFSLSIDTVVYFDSLEDASEAMFKIENFFNESINDMNKDEKDENKIEIRKSIDEETEIYNYDFVDSNGDFFAYADMYIDEV